MSIPSGVISAKCEPAHATNKHESSHLQVCK